MGFISIRFDGCSISGQFQCYALPRSGDTNFVHFVSHFPETLLICYSIRVTQKERKKKKTTRITLLYYSVLTDGKS